MEAVLQGHRRASAFAPQRSQRRDTGVIRAHLERQALRAVAQQVLAVHRRNMTNPILHYTIS